MKRQLELLGTMQTVNWEKAVHESLGKVGEVLVVLNEALQSAKIFTLSTYSQELEMLRRALLCTQDVLLKYRIDGADDKKTTSHMESWIVTIGELANQVRIQVQELVSQVEGEGVPTDEKEQNNAINNTILQMKKGRKRLFDMLYGKILSASGTGRTFDYWRQLERTRGSSPHLHNKSEKYYGRDGDVDTVIHNMLFHLNDVGQMEEVVLEPIVVSIVGFYGIGKTILAHLIFNDERVTPIFHHRVWVGGLHDHFDVTMITESIFRSITSSADTIGSSSDSSLLPHLLQQALRGKRLLLVLDGVWGEVGDQWLKLKDVVGKSGCARGSCVLVTTRSQEVARKMDTSYFHYLKPLTEDVCWSLFAERAFSGTNEDKCGVLVEFCSDFMKRAGGVPLFVNALGCYWRSPKFRRNWIRVSQNRTLDIVPRGDVNYSLYVEPKLEEYDSLPSELKLCLRICSLFPKNSWIKKETVIQMWIALASIRQYEEVKCSHYFDHLLVKTSFFKDLERDDVDGSLVRCRMHPPAHDFVIYNTMDWEQHARIKSTVKHLSLVCTKGAKSINDILDTDRTLQSLLIFGNPTNFEVSSDIFDRFHFLKILDLGGSGITHLPDSLWNLNHLRYLNLSSTKISKLPKSIRGLHSLKILKLSYSGLLKLPEEISLLTSLKHLEIEGTCINFLPKGIGRLTNLQKLTEFIIGDQKGCSIRELGNLYQLQGSLVISNLNKLASADEAKKAKLNQKNHLSCLVLDGQKHFNYHSMDLNKNLVSKALKATKSKKPKEYVETVFEGLEPHENLKRLEIWNYIDWKFPSWMEKPLSNLVSLKLAKCGMVELLPPLGLFPSLKYLHIHGMDMLRHFGHEVYGEGNEAGFPKLECLVFEEMYNWEQWDLKVEKGEMPCLKKLLLRRCSVLSVLSFLPEALTELTLHECPKLEKLPKLPKALKIFMLHHCHTLKELPHLLAPMGKLVLVDCSSLMVLPQLPKTLQELILQNCPKLKPVQGLLGTSIRELGVSNWFVLPSPPQLPETLKVMNIYDYSEPNWNMDTSLLQLEHLVISCKDISLKSLPKFPKLVSLKIMMSSELASLPREWLRQLNTLKTLSIHFCPKLRSLPDELQQLTNLQKIFIVGCRHLKERCQMEKGLDWHKIAHVPYIKIDDKIQPNWMWMHDFAIQSPGHH